MVHPSNKRRHLDPGAAARPPPGSQPMAYAPMDVDAAGAASPATTVGAPTPPVVATPPPAVKVRPPCGSRKVACLTKLQILLGWHSTAIGNDTLRAFSSATTVIPPAPLGQAMPLLAVKLRLLITWIDHGRGPLLQAGSASSGAGVLAGSAPY